MNECECECVYSKLNIIYCHFHTRIDETLLCHRHHQPQLDNHLLLSNPLHGLKHILSPNVHHLCCTHEPNVMYHQLQKMRCGLN